MTRLCAVFLSLFLYTITATADCVGHDLRAGLSAELQTELAQKVAQMPFDQGNHWRATRGDDVVHVIGTLHIDDPRHDAILARLTPVLTSTSIILLEATPREVKELKENMARRPELIFLSGETLIDLLPPDRWQALSDAASARGIPSFMAAKFRPWYLSLVLSVPACAIKDMAGQSNGMDHRIAKLAEKAGIPTRALEPYDTMFRVFADNPMDEQLRYLGTFLRDDADALDNLKTMRNTYFEERHGLAWHFGVMQSRQDFDLPTDEINALFSDLRQDLLSDRNIAWMPRIEAALSSVSGPVVVAVGAAHLSGTDGVLDLLDRAGFTLERRAF